MKAMTEEETKEEEEKVGARLILFISPWCPPVRAHDLVVETDETLIFVQCNYLTKRSSNKTLLKFQIKSDWSVFFGNFFLQIVFWLKWKVNKNTKCIEQKSRSENAKGERKQFLQE